jgi:hypothetical protein
MAYLPSVSRSIPTSTALSLRSSSQSIGARRRFGSASRTELADPLCALELGQHEDVPELGAWCRAEGVQVLTWPALELVETAWSEATWRAYVVPHAVVGSSYSARAPQAEVLLAGTSLRPLERSDVLVVRRVRRHRRGGVGSTETGSDEHPTRSATSAIPATHFITTCPLAGTTRLRCLFQGLNLRTATWCVMIGSQDRLEFLAQCQAPGAPLPSESVSLVLSAEGRRRWSYLLQ